MEELANEFREDFLAAVKVLEDFSSSDVALRDALNEIRRRIDEKKYISAPNFWEDLRETLGAIEQQRDEKASKNKAQQVMKQITRLEVKFEAKESISMLRELDPEFRLERMVDWIETFEAGESGDPSSSSSSGPAVLFAVLNDISLQRDMEPIQKESLTNSIRSNLNKFPYEMQAVLERVGSVQSGGVTARIVNDWRRRAQPASQEQLAGSGTNLNFLLAKSRAGGFAEVEEGKSGAADDIDGVPVEPQSFHGDLIGATGDHDQEEDEEIVARIPFNVNDVPPETMEKAKATVIAMLRSNAGECPKRFVRNILKQVGIAGCPIAALGDEIFFSGAEVFLRRAGAPVPPPAMPPLNRRPVPEELKQDMLALVQEAEGRIILSQLAEKLQWHPGSLRHQIHGPLRRAVGQAVELFFEPDRVFLVEVARQHVSVLAPQEEEGDGEAVPQEQPVEESAATPYVADPFAELVATVLAWLQQAGGSLGAGVVLQLIKTLGFKPKAVITALSREVFWSHPEAEYEILLRTRRGAEQHPNALPINHLHPVVHQDIIRRLREMGPHAKLDKLAGALGWNKTSGLRKTYGMLRVVISGLREVFYDPQRLYLKKALDGVVEWPVNKHGHLGPQAARQDPVVRWTPAADDPKAQGDPEWMNVKRQVIGTIMGHGGRCAVGVLRQLLQTVNGGTTELENLFEPDSERNLNALLFWNRDRVCGRQPHAIEAARLQMEDQVSSDVKKVLISAVRSKGTATLSELRSALEDANLTVDDHILCNALQQIAEIFFMPEMVFLQCVVQQLIVEAPLAEGAAIDPSPEDSATQAEKRAALLAAEAETSEDVAMQALSEAAALLPDDAKQIPEVAADVTAPETKTGVGPDFFDFTEFEKHPETHHIVTPAKKRRLDNLDGWANDTLPWATEGAAVRVRREQADVPVESGTIVRMNGNIATVRVVSSDEAAGLALGKERDIPTAMLVPVAPSVGAMVKVVGGSRSGCYGKLIGLPGANGIVQIGSLNYETVPLNQLAVLASSR